MIRFLPLILASGLIAGTVHLPVTDPQAVHMGPSTTVHVSVRVSGENVSLVQLHEVDQGRARLVGTLTDDGRNGDRRPGDGSFGGNFALGRPSPGVQTLRVTAVVDGKPLASEDAWIETFEPGTPITAWRGNAKGALKSGNATAACDELTLVAPMGTNVALVREAVRQFGGEVIGLTVGARDNLWNVRMPCAASYDQLLERVRMLEQLGFDADVAGQAPLMGVPYTEERVAQQLEVSNARIAWNVTLGAGVVAVVDTGADFNHDDLAFRLIPGKNFADGPPTNLTDNVGHGTAMASIAVAALNGRGFAGMAPNATALIVKATDGIFVWLPRASSAVRFAAEQDVRVINCSFSSSINGLNMKIAVDHANRAGILVVAGGGNFRDDHLWYPAGFPDTFQYRNRTLLTRTLSVNGHELDGTGWVHSSLAGAHTGPGTDIDALADPHRVAIPGGGDGIGVGTSGATAIVSGAALLVMAARPSLSHDEVFQVLTSTVTVGPGKHVDGRFVKKLDVWKAVFQAAAVPCVGCPTTPEVTVRGSTVDLGVARARSGTQPAGIHAVYLPLRPAARYTIAKSWHLKSFDSYSAASGFNDFFSVSLHPSQYHQRNLSDPITAAFLNSSLIWGGVGGSTEVEQNFVPVPISGVLVNPTTLVNPVLSIVLDTFTLPGRTSTFPSWGTITIHDITPEP